MLTFFSELAKSVLSNRLTDLKVYIQQKLNIFCKTQVDMFLGFHTTHITRYIFVLKKKNGQMKHEVQSAVRLLHMINKRKLFKCKLQLKESQFLDKEW